MLNGHPTLMQEAEKKGVKVGMVPLPGVDGPTKGSMGVADWMMGFKQNGHRDGDRQVPRLRLHGRERARLRRPVRPAAGDQHRVRRRWQADSKHKRSASS